MSSSLRSRVHELLEIGRSGDRASRAFDVALVTLIVLSVAASLIATVPDIYAAHRAAFDAFEMLCVAIFSLEYVFRLICAVERKEERFHHPIRGRLRYLFTPLALADLAAILPFYLAAWVNVDLRLLRLLRLVRIFKLAHYFSALSVLLDVIRQERNAFGAAYFIVCVGLTVAASGVYVFEHEAQPEAFGSVAEALWWAIATLTTVGYGDVTPVTTGGRLFGGVVMMLGVGTVAIPTGILATGFALELQRRRDRYQAELRTALADGVVDASERAHLEAVRRALDLDSAQIEGVAEAIERLPAVEPLGFCPHCGEALDASETKPLADADTGSSNPPFCKT